MEGSPFNPVNLGDQAESASYGKALDLLLEDPGVGDILVIKAPSAFGDTAAIADAIVERQSATRHCLLASFPGPVAGEMARQRTMENGIPTYETPQEAVRVFMRMFQHKRNRRLLMETPPSMPEEFKPDVGMARHLIHGALAAQREQLNELEAMRLLSAYGIPTVDTHIANDPFEAEEIADRLNRTVALKIVSEDIPHKRLVGGLARYLNSPKVVRETAEAMLSRVRELAPTARIEGFLIQPIAYRGDAYEMTVGVGPGGAFGPVIYFGQGGTDTRIIGDIAYGLPPLNMNLARETMSQTRIYHSLRYSLLRRVDLDALALTLIKVSQMVIDLGEIVELEINPLRASDQGVIALDAKVRVAEFAGAPSERLAIRPYPMEMEERLVLSDGRDLLIRPILPEDEPALQAQVRRTSSWDLRLRFFQPIRELPHEVAARLTQIDYNCEMGLVVVGPGRPGEAEIYAAVHLISDPDNDRAEYSLIVDRGLEEMEVGLLLMRRIVDYARRRGIREIYGEVLQENEGMLRIDKALGFKVTPQPDAPGLLYVSLKL
jgi:acetyltransferase